MAKIGYGASYGFLLAIISLVLGGVFVYKSTALVMVLKPDPPAGFFEEKANWTPAQRQAQERLARAYWDTARKLSRSVYVYGDRLPEDPPDTFAVDEKAYPSAGEPSSVARARYWRNLQKVWNSPEAWKRTYEWHTSWFFEGTSY